MKSQRFKANKNTLDKPQITEPNKSLKYDEAMIKKSLYPLNPKVSDSVVSDLNLNKATDLATRVKRFSQLLEGMPDAVIGINKNGEIVYVNNQASILFGYSAEELLGNKIEMLIPQRTQEKHSQLRKGYYSNPIKRIMGEGSQELFGRKKDGSEFACDISSNSLETEEGLVILSAIRDSTEKIQIAEKLAASEELLQATEALAKVGGWEINLSNMTVRWTDEVFRIHELEPGRTPPVEEAINYYAPEARPIIQQAVSSSIVTGKGWDLELPFITAKGKHLWVRAIGQTEMKNNKATRVFGVFQDITEKKKAEEALLEAIKERERLSDELEKTKQLARQKRELENAENIQYGASSKITEEMLGIKSIREFSPDFFYNCTIEFANIMDLAIEDKLYKTNHDIPNTLRGFADDLGTSFAKPRDIVEIYSYALDEKIKTATYEASEAYLEEGRLLLIMLMGFMVEFYHKYVPVNLIFKTTNKIKKKD